MLPSEQFLLFWNFLERGNKVNKLMDSISRRFLCSFLTSQIAQCRRTLQVLGQQRNTCPLTISAAEHCSSRKNYSLPFLLLRGQLKTYTVSRFILMITKAILWPREKFFLDLGWWYWAREWRRHVITNSSLAKKDENYLIACRLALTHIIKPRYLTNIETYKRGRKGNAVMLISDRKNGNARETRVSCAKTDLWWSDAARDPISFHAIPSASVCYSPLNPSSHQSLDGSPKKYIFDDIWPTWRTP